LSVINFARLPTDAASLLSPYVCQNLSAASAVTTVRYKKNKYA